MPFFRRFLASFLVTLALLGFAAGFIDLSFSGEQITGVPGFYAAAMQTAQNLLFPEYAAAQVLAQTGSDGRTPLTQLLDWIEQRLASLHYCP